MAGLIGIAPMPRLAGATNPVLAPELAALADVRFVPAAHARASLAAWAGVWRAPDALRWPATGRLAHRFVEDYYDRIHVLPTALSLGNVVSELTREIVVWNAWRTVQQALTALRLDGDAGSTLVAPGALPLLLRSLQEQVLTLTVGLDGPPVLEATATLAFAGGAIWSIRIDGLRLQAWTLPPNWSEPLTETLAWLTDVQVAVAGTVTRTPLRDAPRRSWEFAVLADRNERRRIEHALFDWTARVWALPVFVDTLWLGTFVPPGAMQIVFDTSGLDFVVGGLAMLWRDVATHELVEIAQIANDRVGLRAPTRHAWPVGTRLIPCRTARLTDAPELRRLSDRLVSAQLRFESTEPSDWPAVLPATRYRGLPVLEHRGDESTDPVASIARRVDLLDGEVGRTHADDGSGLAWTTQSHAWRLVGRAERAAHRSLLYGLQGRAEALWLPTWTDDLEVIEPIGESAVTLIVAACGISRSLRQQAGRRHLRIELVDGIVFYRAIEASTEIPLANGETGERLRIDAALGAMVTPERVRLVCWMALVTLAGDAVELHHHADSDGLLDCAVSFAGIPAEEP
ncbi:MAG: hypothetical protein NFW04_14330 [Candidatus Accumulibacter sp.]|uniref:hypothetical protein n=1 Tax=Accumulibacter sp. TaxID=2053492 RepID=UPI0025DA72CD|nr:hypothetical protein [Accumulibacter sp.]MCM8599809.1 hypothetical protein [Accumulibacter sp.]